MRYYQRLGLGLLLAAFALTPNCPGSDSSNGGGDPTTFTLTVTRPANGSIAVGAPVDMTCDSAVSPAAEDCTYTIPKDTVVTLTATADMGYEFTSWGGHCSGSATCTLTMDRHRTASAQFLPAGTETRMLTVIRPANGSIEVAYPSFTATCSRGSGECPYTIPKDRVVTLTASADTGFTFTSWGDDCSGMSGNTCTLTMSEDRTASAVFTNTPRTLTVTPPTNGSIAVGAPVDMTCNSGDSAPSCIYLIPDGTMVTLTATGEVGYMFDSWSTCPDTESGNTCTLTMDADKTAGASFVVCDLSNDDLDCDHDGTNNGDDAFPDNGCASTDTDGDGLPDSIIDSCSTTLIADAFPDNADVQDAIALFSLGEMDGDFGFDACQNFLNERTSPKPRADDMYGRGFRTAKFYGSTPDYHFPDLHTNAEGLNLMTSAEFRLPVAVFMEVSAGSTHSFPVSSGTTRITIADLVAVDSGGAWTTTNLFTNALDPIISDAGDLFWSFTSNRVYDASTSCSGATSMSTGFGRRGTRDAIGSSSGSGCSSPLDVLCVARR